MDSNKDRQHSPSGNIEERAVLDAIRKGYQGRDAQQPASKAGELC